MTEQMFEHPIQSIGAVAAATGISRATVFPACKKGKLRECSYKSEDVWLIDTTSPQFTEWLAAHPTQKRVRARLARQAEEKTES